MSQHAGVHEKGTYNLEQLMKSVKQNKDFTQAGAICLFVGVARGKSNDGEKVTKLALEAYEDKANQTLSEICDDLEKKPGIVDVQIHHLLGDFAVGEDMVYVSVVGSHRQEAFAVLREAVERYKHEAPVFKKEETIDEKGATKAEWVSEKTQTEA